MIYLAMVLMISSYNITFSIDAFMQGLALTITLAWVAADVR